MSGNNVTSPSQPRPNPRLQRTPSAPLSRQPLGDGEVSEPFKLRAKLGLFSVRP